MDREREREREKARARARARENKDTGHTDTRTPFGEFAVEAVLGKGSPHDIDQLGRCLYLGNSRQINQY